MYKHLAESIKETNDKMFVSLDEKTKYNNYENVLRRKDDSYSKTEVDNKIKELSDNTYGTVEASHVSESNTLDGYIKDLEILGNTVQNQDNLADIKSVGILQEDGTYKMSIVSCGKNIVDAYSNISNLFINSDGTNTENNSWRSTNDYYIVKENTKYVISENRSSNNFEQYTIAFYDKDLNFKECVSLQHSGKFTTPSGTKYIRFAYSVSVHGNPITRIDLQIEEGEKSTEYEPYKESIVDITLPCQLEKIGDVADRIYYNNIEKAWCIEKNIVTRILNGSESGNDNRQYTNTIIFNIDSYSVKPLTTTNVVISDRFISDTNTNWEQDKECIWGNELSRICIRISRSKLETQDVAGCKKWLSENNTLIKYATNMPEKITLPLDTQIQLNSFANKTHIYMVSGEVEGTIKATLPKSLSASVQSLNDKTDMMENRIKDIETLKEGQNISYESDKGYVLCENTNNGQIDNIKIEGKTLVNVLPVTGPELTIYTSTILYHNAPIGKFKFKDNTLYTLIILGTTPNFNGKLSIKNITGGQIATSNFMTTFTTGTVDMSLPFQLHLYGSGFTDDVKSKIKAICLEGDHTHNPPSYFEGLMSVGDDVDEIEVVSNTNNLFDINKGVNEAYDHLVYDYDNEILPDGGIKVYNYSSGHHGKGQIIKVKKYTNYTLSCKVVNDGMILVHSSNTWNNIYRRITNTKSHITFNTGNMDEICLTFDTFGASDVTKAIFYDVQLNIGDESQYSRYKSHNKSLLYYNDLGELVPVPELHEWDSIEKHSDGKYYYHKRSEKIILNGSENWANYIHPSQIGETTIPFYLTDVLSKRGSAIICDKFNEGPVYSTSNNIVDYEAIAKDGNQDWLIVRILKSKLSSENVEGFKSWLQSNPVTLVYQLAEEQVYECINLNLDTYDNETMVMLNSGSISPKIDFTYSSHIGSTISILRERLKAVEESFTKDKISQNRIQLNSIYSSDKLVFNIDISTCSNRINEFDEDLFELITEVLLSGKDNYNLNKMESIIDFYTMIGKLSFYMADILFEIIDRQNNPIIEIPEKEIEILPEI